jgi:hypothetical protein
VDFDVKKTNDNHYIVYLHGVLLPSDSDGNPFLEKEHFFHASTNDFPEGIAFHIIEKKEDVFISTLGYGLRITRGKKNRFSIDVEENENIKLIDYEDNDPNSYLLHYRTTVETPSSTKEIWEKVLSLRSKINDFAYQECLKKAQKER